LEKPQARLSKQLARGYGSTFFIKPMQNNENFAENANAPLIRVEQDNLEFSIIQDYVESGEEYPVPFEEFWTWVGYATKQKAENCLLKNFKPQIDFNFNQEVKVQMEGKRQVKRSINTYYLTLDCAKAFAMLAQTDRGQEIRGYFLDCEKKLKAIQKKLVTEDRLNRVLTIIEGNFTKVGEYMGDLEERLEKRLDALEARHQQNTGKIDDTTQRVDKIEEHCLLRVCM
jgi:phage anti-repressor protein